MINEFLAYNKAFVEHSEFEPYRTSKYPNKKLAIVTCMDTRLTELLPAALGIKNGDAKIIKNAGGVITHPFGSAVRSLLIAIYELDVTDVMVIGHTDCGVQHMDGEKMLQEMQVRGVGDNNISVVRCFKSSTLFSICFIVFINSVSLLPLGSSSPQSSRYLQGKVGHDTLQPIVTTISIGTISARTFECCESSISML